MTYTEGQGVLGRVRFQDGTMPEYERTYLVVSSSNEFIKVLNVSSIRGKERKLKFPSNEKMRIYKPPFLKPSFVKLDSQTIVHKADWKNLKVLHQGQPLDKNELARIQSMLLHVN